MEKQTSMAKPLSPFPPSSKVSASSTTEHIKDQTAMKSVLSLTFLSKKPSLRSLLVLFNKMCMRTMQMPSEQMPGAQLDRTTKQRYNEICELESYDRLISDCWAMSAPTTQHRLAAG